MTHSARPLTVRSGSGLAGSFDPPGDKSITHRAYLFGLMAGGETRVVRPNRGADCESSLACARQLGAVVTPDAGGARIAGRDLDLAEADGVLDCGNSGTTLRLLAGILAGQRGLAILDGDASLRQRPVARIVEPLGRMGAFLAARDGDRLPPLVIRGGPLRGMDHELPIPSAQVLGCLILAGLQAAGSTTVALPGAARDHTERMLPTFGIEPEIRSLASGGRRVTVHGPARMRGAALEIPGDFSGAAFFLAAAAATPGSRVTARGVGLNPTRTALLEVLDAMGADVETVTSGDGAGEPVGDVTVTGPDALRPFDVPAEWVPRLLDEVPAWTVAASAAVGRSRLVGAAELRVKESDRLHVLATELGRLGLAVREQPDGLEVTGGRVQGGAVRARGDHRIAMTLALLGSRAETPVTIDDAASIDTSFPGFTATLRHLGGHVDAGEAGA